MANADISAFHGGMTDSYVNAAANKYESADNMVIRPDTTIQTRPGTRIMSSTAYQIPFVTDPVQADTITKFKGSRLYQGANRLFYDTVAGMIEVQGPGGASLFPPAVLSSNRNSYAEWNNHLFISNDRRVRPTFMFLDGVDWNLRTLGLPKITNAEVTAIGVSGTGSDSRLYRFVRSHTYSINGVEFKQTSAVSADKASTGAFPVTLSSLPILVNGSYDHYETSTVKIEIYRTVNTGATYYKVGEVTNGTTSFIDNIADVAIQLNETLYLEGDELDYDQVPEAKYVIQNDGVLFLLNIKDVFGNVLPNTIAQANPDQPYASPGANTASVDGDITGGGVAGQFPIVFTESRTYRLNGIYDSTGGGGVTPVEVSRTVGCISHKSIVTTQDGLFFAAKDGFYFTDGYKVVRISEDLPKTYLKLVKTREQAERIHGAYDPASKSIYWAATEGESEPYNDVIFIAHTYFGITPAPFTRWHGGYWRESFNPVSIFFDTDENYLYRGEKAGYILVHDPELINDLRIVPELTPDLWNKIPVIYDWKSIATNFGSVNSRKWVTRLIVYADALGKVTMAPSSQNDNTQVWNDMAEIRSGTPLVWGDTDVLWGDGSIRWNYIPIVSANRRFPKKSIRCSYKQVRLTNSFTLIEDTRTMGQAVFDGVAKTATIVNPGVEWSNNAQDYFISTSSDGYIASYRITGRTPTEITVEDIGGNFPTGTFDFKINGYRLDEALRLLSLALIYQPIGSSQTPFKDT